MCSRLLVFSMFCTPGTEIVPVTPATPNFLGYSIGFPVAYNRKILSSPRVDAFPALATQSYVFHPSKWP